MFKIELLPFGLSTLNNVLLSFNQVQPHGQACLQRMAIQTLGFHTVSPDFRIMRFCIFYKNVANVPPAPTRISLPRLYSAFMNILITSFLHCQQGPYAFLFLNDSLYFHLYVPEAHTEEKGED